MNSSGKRSRTTINTMLSRFARHVAHKKLVGQGICEIWVSYRTNYVVQLLDKRRLTNRRELSKNVSSACCRMMNLTSHSQKKLPPNFTWRISVLDKRDPLSTDRFLITSGRFLTNRLPLLGYSFWYHAEDGEHKQQVGFCYQKIINRAK